jgi:hypothetical protein
MVNAALVQHLEGAVERVVGLRGGCQLGAGDGQRYRSSRVLVALGYCQGAETAPIGFTARGLFCHQELLHPGLALFREYGVF